MVISIGRIFGETARLTANDAAFALLLVIGLTILAVLGDVYAPDAVVLLNIVTVVAHFYVLRRLVVRNGLATSDRLGGFGGFFGVGILTGLAILAGMLALIVPGLFLAARWGIANMVMIAEDRSASNAIGKSWVETKGHSVAVMIALGLLLVPGAIGLGGSIATGYYAVPLGEPGGIGLDAVLNGLISVSQVLAWYFEVALYIILVGSPGDALKDVFA